MSEHSHLHQTVLEVAFPDHPNQLIPVTHSPFHLGRGSDNHLLLEDARISHRCASIVEGKGGHTLVDRGSHTGVFINGEKVVKRTLCDGDRIAFGLGDGCTIIFRSTAAQATLANVLARMGKQPNGEAAHPAHGLTRLNLLLEATSLLHSQLPLDSVLGAMLDHAISITKAESGLLLEPDGAGVMKPLLARNSSGESLALEHLSHNQAALERALEQKSASFSSDVPHFGALPGNGEGNGHPHLRSIVVTPLLASSASDSEASGGDARGELLGAIYLHSRHSSAFSELDCQILDALGCEASSILGNARHLQRERERRLLEHELSIARNIQQALLPKGFRDFLHLTITGANYPCIAVGGDYYDVYPVSDDRTAVLIADVSGHGLGAAMLTTMLQGALTGMRLVEDPVRVFNQINQLLCGHSEVGKYATMFFSILGSDGTLEYIKAGHPSPLLLRRGEISELYTEGSFPVGLIAEAEFSAASVQLEPEDTLILFSDGVTEAEDPDGNEFGVDRLREVLAGHENDSLDQLKKLVLEAVDRFARGAAQLDDITVLVVRYRATA
jgi:serine phosphatase RsbU (regulator of sigma subunit)